MVVNQMQRKEIEILEKLMLSSEDEAIDKRLVCLERHTQQRFTDEKA
jgi:hypothetical protein